MANTVFEEMAKRYDSDSRIELANIIAKEVRQELGSNQLDSLIDYGAGTGLVGLQLVDLVESVLLVDSSEQMMKIAEAKIVHSGLSNVRTFVSDFTEETIDLKADIILVSLVLLHIPNTDVILKQLYTVLNDGGKLLIVDFDKEEAISHPKVHNGFVHAELKEKLAAVGFKSSDIKTFHHGKNIFMNKDASLFIASCIK